MPSGMESTLKSCTSTSATDWVCSLRTNQNAPLLKGQNIRFNFRYMRHCRKGIWSASSTSFARQFVHRAGSRQPSKEAHDKNRGNDRRAERCEESRPRAEMSD